MAVREPILKALLGYRKAKSETEKEAHRRRLRELFEKIEASAAEPFEGMLSTPNALAVTFRTCSTAILFTTSCSAFWGRSTPRPRRNARRRRHPPLRRRA